MITTSSDFQTAAKATVRQVKAKVDIIWTSPTEDTSITSSTNIEARINQCLQNSANNIWIDTGKKAITDFSEFETWYLYSSANNGRTEYLFGFFESIAKTAGVYRSPAGPEIKLLELGGTIRTFDASAYDGEYLKIKYVASATLGNKYYIYDMDDNLLYENVPIAGDCTSTHNLYIFRGWDSGVDYWTDEDGFVIDETGEPVLKT